MQINRAELQKVRVKLSRDALTIQKEGRASPSSSPINQPEVGQYNVFGTFLILLSRSTRHLFWIRFKFFPTWFHSSKVKVCSAMHAMEVLWLLFQSSELFDFLFAIALHSFLIKQENEMNKELCDRFSEVLFASIKDHLLMLGAHSSGWPKFSRRTHKQVIMIAFFVNLCSMLQIDL